MIFLKMLSFLSNHFDGSLYCLFGCVAHLEWLDVLLSIGQDFDQGIGKERLP